MSRRSTPDRIYAARRAATIARLVGDGQLRDRAEALVARWEAVAGERPRDRVFWEAFEAWRVDSRS